MLICQDCGSSNIVEKEVYNAYFREGDWVRLRSILVWSNENEHTPKGFMASCPELSRTACSIGDTQLDAILKLGELLRIEFSSIKLIGQEIVDG